MSKNGKFTCPKTNEPCAGTCKPTKKPNQVLYSKTIDGEWMEPETINELLALIGSLPPASNYRLVAGNTGTGWNDPELLMSTVINL